VQKAKAAVRPTKTDAKFVMYYELLEAFREPGCPVCTRLEQVSLRALDELLYEQVTDPATRARLLASRGFCNRHAWMLPRIQNSRLGTAVIYHHLLTSALECVTPDTAGHQPRRWWRRLSRRATEHPDGLLSLVAWWNARTPCPLCIRSQQVERNHLTALLGFLEEAGFSEALRTSDGLCVPHLCRTMAIGRDHPGLPALLSIQGARWSALAAELTEFIRKNDYRFAAEPVGQEGDSWHRALEALAGRAGAPDRERRGGPPGPPPEAPPGERT
jgi:hypothetical protein